MQRRDFLLGAAASAAACSLTRFTQGEEPSDVLSAKPLAKPPVELEQTASDQYTLRFTTPNARPLRILQITDTHFGNPDDDHRQRDARTMRGIRAMCEEQAIDLVAHTGDFVNNDRGPQIRWDALDFLNQLGIPWTHTLGNHDIGAVSTEEYRGKVRNAALGYFDSNGSREYAFRIDVTSPAEEKPRFTLFCFDSGFQPPQKHVSRGQLDWFAEQLERDKSRGATCPAIALVHIPVVEFESLRSHGGFSGIYGEKVCFETDTGKTFDAFSRSGRVRAVFSGHDHENDYHGAWKGIELVYGRVSGWSGYGDLQRGGQLIELDLDAGTYRHKLVFPKNNA